ncbi:MAG: uroporphyrinogen decarboxylase family protein [Desulfuromonadaceae bacterium]
MSALQIKDEMTPKERMKAYLGGEPFDRIPCGLMLSDYAARVLGCSVREYQLSAEVMAQGQIAAWQRYGHDGINVGVGLTGIAEVLGSGVTFPENGAPYISRPGLDDITKQESLPIPDTKTAGRFPLIMEALERLLDGLGDTVPVSVSLPGPFTSAANTRGTEAFMRDLVKHPEAAHRLIRRALEVAVGFVVIAAPLGVKISIGDPSASGALISPRLFREFAQPYLKELSDAIIKHTGFGPSLHICGNTSKVWQEMADSGAGLLSLDNVIDLAEAKAAVGGRVVLIGNIHPTATMFLGTPDDVRANARECLRKAWDSPKKFILSLGCGLPIDTPQENIDALMAAARSYGRYPLNPDNFS